MQGLVSNGQQEEESNPTYPPPPPAQSYLFHWLFANPCYFLFRWGGATYILMLIRQKDFS